MKQNVEIDMVSVDRTYKIYDVILGMRNRNLLLVHKEVNSLLPNVKRKISRDVPVLQCNHDLSAEICNWVRALLILKISYIYI